MAYICDWPTVAITLLSDTVHIRDTIVSSMLTIGLTHTLALTLSFVADGLVLADQHIATLATQPGCMFADLALVHFHIRWHKGQSAVLIDMLHHKTFVLPYMVINKCQVSKHVHLMICNVLAGSPDLLM